MLPQLKILKKIKYRNKKLIIETKKVIKNGIDEIDDDEINVTVVRV